MAALGRILLCAVCLLFLAAQEKERTVWDGVFTAEQAKRGEPLYRKECAACHGDLLTGGEMAPPLSGGEFLSNWDGLTVGDLYERIRKTMPSTKPGKLSPKVNADITAYMLGFNQFPAGEHELPASAGPLKKIRIQTEKK